MRYISPFHYLPAESLNDILADTSKIKLVRKRLLAEVELSDTQSIFIGDKELTKFDVINLFDNLSDTSLLEIHAGIFKDKLLLDFLENGNFTTNSNAYFNPRLTSDLALQLISPYYKEISLDLLNDAVAKKDIEFIKSYFSISHLMNNENTFELYEYLTKKIMLLVKPITALENKIRENQKPNVEDFNNLELGTFIKLLNNLPDDFSKLREDVATSFNDLGCVLINNSYNSYAESLFIKAQFLNCSEFMKGYFDRNLATAKSNIGILGTSSSSNRKSSGNNRNYSLIGIIAFVIVRIIISVSSSSSHTDYTPTGDFSDYIPEKVEDTSTDYTVKYNTNTEPILEEKVHSSNPDFASYNQANNSFDNFMTLLYNQYLMFSPKEKIQKDFKTGDNVYKTLLATDDFMVSPSRNVYGNKSSDKIKKVKFINKTDYECILITRNTILRVPVEITTKYIPAHGSLELNLKDGYHDIRPYMGNNLIKNEFYNIASVSNTYYHDFIPEYLFETVPRKNKLLNGITFEFKEIKNTNAIIVLEEIDDELESDISKLK